MALLSATELLDLQSDAAINEKRFNQQGILAATLDSSREVNFIPPSVRAEMATMSNLRDARLPVLQDQTVTVNQTPGFDFIPANMPTSAVYNFTAYDVFSGFRHFPAQFANNHVDEAFTKREVMKNVLHEMANTCETILAARYEERKTQLLNHTVPVSQGDGTFTFDAPTDVLQINKAAQKETMFNQLTALMRANKLAGNYRLISSPAGLAVQMSEALKYGNSNDKNLQALGFFSPDRIYESDNISAGSDVFQGWLIRDGSIGIVTNHPYDFMNGTSVGAAQWSVSNANLPFLGMRANVYVNNEATEATSLVTSGTDVHLKMTAFQEMAIWARFYVVYPYNSDLTTRPQDIVKVTGLTT